MISPRRPATIFTTTISFTSSICAPIRTTPRRVTVPVLWDKKNQTIVSNESAEIIRMFNTAFDAHGARAGDYYPVELREKLMS